MKIFPEQPKVSKEDTLRIFPRITNRKNTRDWLKTNPELEDLKRAVLIEVFRCVNHVRPALTTIQRGVYQDILAAIMKRERSSIDEAVMDVLTEADEKKKGSKR